MTVPSVGKILNDAQVSLAVHKKCVKQMISRRHADQDAFLPELCNAILPVLLEFKRDLCAERIVRFLVSFTSARPEGFEEASDDFTEAFLGFLLNLATARDKAVRFRTCQIVAGVLNALGPEAEISDDLYERMEDVMLERLRDKTAAVRAQAARALSRLQDGGEGGDFSDDKITSAFLTLLGAEKQPQVRKAILGSLAISDHTIPHVVERTRDAADDVRRVAYLALTSKVPVESVSIALRAAAIRRGLAERSPSVRQAAVEMLKRWWLAFEGDVLALLAALDAETNEHTAEAVVKELIACGKIKPDEVAQSVANGNPPGGGLRRDTHAMRTWREDPSMLLTPEAAVYWRVVCEALQLAVTQSGVTAATAVGQNQVVSAAVAGERIDALEAALPVCAKDLLDLVTVHADAGAVFVARQLLQILNLVDLADATARRGAAAFVNQQLRKTPTNANDAHLDVSGTASSYALGGTGAWERCLVQTLRAVSEPTDVVAVVVAAADALRSSGDDASTAQALFLCALLLENVQRAAVSLETGEGIMQTLVRPGVTHVSASVRKEAVKTLGLLGVVRGVASDDGETVRVLRTALAADAPAVRCIAAKALGDLALLYGAQELDKQVNATNEAVERTDADEAEDSEEEAGNAPSLLNCPITDALCFVMDEPVTDDFAALDENAQFNIDANGVDVTGGAAVAEAELEGCPGTAAAEALAKLVLRRGKGGFVNGSGIGHNANPSSDATVVVAKLLAQYLCVDPRARPRLAQCLAVFFPSLASAPPDRRRLVADAAIPVLRALSVEKGVARVAVYLAHLLDFAAVSAEQVSGGDDGDVSNMPVSKTYAAGGVDLLCALCEEALAVTSRPVSSATTVTEKALAKAYVAALAKLAVATNVAPAFTVGDYDEKSVAYHSLIRCACAAEAAAAKVPEKIASRDLAAVAVKARAAAGDEAPFVASGLGLREDDVETPAATPVCMSETFNELAVDSETRGEDVGAVAPDADEEAANDADTPGVEVEDQAAVTASDEAEAPAPDTPGADKKTAPSKPRTSRKKSEKAVETAKPTRASRRGALAENVAR
mmetsp:Transcript_73/g.228  ORF Transcript_73/g.228 Transcript_73/m.228 type:complete len:1067 (-) Transcript_73:82-3282(-)